MSTEIQSDLAIAAMAMPSGKTEVVLQFNKITGAFLAALSLVDPATLNQEFFVYAIDEMDFDTEEVVGDYPNYEIRLKQAEKPRIYEVEMDLAAQAKITKRYPVVQQVNVVSDAINSLAAAVQGLLTEVDPTLETALNELNEMRDYINEVKTDNARRKAFYRDSPEFDYVSNEDVAEQYERQLEGGLHEAYGPREITGGSVF